FFLYNIINNIIEMSLIKPWMGEKERRETTSDNFEDLLRLNILSFSGVIDSFNALEEEHSKIADKLIEVNKYGLYTIDGQGGESGCIKEDNVRQQIQKPYLIFYIHKKRKAVHYIKELLEVNSTLMLFQIADSKRVISTNFPTDNGKGSVAVTMERESTSLDNLYSAPWIVRSGDTESYYHKNHYNTLIGHIPFLKNSDDYFYIHIIYDVWCSPMVVEDFIINSFKKNKVNVLRNSLGSALSEGFEYSADVPAGQQRTTRSQQAMLQECYNKNNCDYILKLNPILKESLGKYIWGKLGTFHEDVHEVLRNEKEESQIVVKVIKDIDEIFTNSPKTTKDLVVYKGIYLHKFPKLIEKSFISTSLQRNTAMEFTADKRFGTNIKDNVALLKIRVPRNSSALNLYCLDNHECEILLPRNGNFKIDKITDTSDTYTTPGRSRRVQEIYFKEIECTWNEKQ
ncbi:MAG: ADP-ribosyltransferase, partial [Clostridium sp.]